jgi:hypothetical protein
VGIAALAIVGALFVDVSIEALVAPKIHLEQRARRSAERLPVRTIGHIDRLLSETYDVEAVPGGEFALQAASRQRGTRSVTNPSQEVKCKSVSFPRARCCQRLQPEESGS